MKREQFLRNRLEMASPNLMCYSANYSMTEPKEGFEAEYKEASEEVESFKRGSRSSALIGLML